MSGCFTEGRTLQLAEVGALRVLLISYYALMKRDFDAKKCRLGLYVKDDVGTTEKSVFDHCGTMSSGSFQETMILHLLWNA